MQTLIVDDSKTMRIIIKNILLETGLIDSNIYQANDGIEALSILKNDILNIQLIILDWNMPNLNGLDFFKKIKSIDTLKDIPVIMITTECSKAKVVEAIKAGIFDYMVKPFNIKTLKTKIKFINDNILINKSNSIIDDDSEFFNYLWTGQSNLNVLIVDDSKTMRRVLVEKLLDLGLKNEEIHEAEDGLIALKYLKFKPIQLILLDCIMPNLNGIDFLKKIKNSPQLKNIPVIMITNESGKKNIVESIKAGIFDYMTKPFTFEELEFKVNRMIETHLNSKERGFLQEKMSDGKKKRLKDLSTIKNINVIIKDK